MQIGLPITGKYRDPESDQYYNNNNVRDILYICELVYKYEHAVKKNYLNELIFRVQKSYKPLILIMNMSWDTKSLFCAWQRVIQGHI